ADRTPGWRRAGPPGLMADRSGRARARARRSASSASVRSAGCRSEAMWPEKLAPGGTACTFRVAADTLFTERTDDGEVRARAQRARHPELGQPVLARDRSRVYRHRWRRHARRGRVASGTAARPDPLAASAVSA